MQRPDYPPAAAFEQPTVVPYERLATATASLASLKTSPEAWAIVVKHAPMLNAMGNGPLAGAFPNMTVDAFVSFGDISEQSLSEINAELAQLPRNTWPAQ